MSGETVLPLNSENSSALVLPVVPHLASSYLEIRRTQVKRAAADRVTPSANGQGIGDDGGPLQGSSHLSECMVWG